MTVEVKSLEDFYKEAEIFMERDLASLLPPGINRDIGHFNVFDIRDTMRKIKQGHPMPYNRRAYYKISLIRGRNRAEYADKVIQIKENALLFATPKVPYHWVPEDENQSGSFCVFTDTFLIKEKSGINLDAMPIYMSGGYPVFEISDEVADEINLIFNKMKRDIVSEYPYKYDLIRNYVLELIHYGQKMQPSIKPAIKSSSGNRIISLFLELLERQFPIDSPSQQLPLRSPKEYAARLAIHVNYLNKVLKENTGRTTTEIIHHRILQEAKILLKSTDWSISEIGYTLGFEEVAHFSNFFKKHAQITPLAYRPSQV